MICKKRGLDAQRLKDDIGIPLTHHAYLGQSVMTTYLQSPQQDERDVQALNGRAGLVYVSGEWVYLSSWRCKRLS